MSKPLLRIVHPRYVALDSSHLGAIAADKVSPNSSRRAKVEAFEAAFEESGAVLVLCWHHLQELFTHRDKQVVENRVNYLRSLPMAAGIASYRGAGVIGTFLDLQCFEVKAAFEDRSASTAAVRDQAAKNMFRLASGADFVEPFLREWSVLRDEFYQHEQRNRERIAISKSAFADISNTKIFDLLRGRRRSQPDIEKQFEMLQGRLTTEIQQRGDHRISDPEAVALEFLEPVREWGLNNLHPDNPALGILKLFGLSLSDIGPDTTVADVGDLAVFRRKLGSGPINLL